MKDNIKEENYISNFCTVTYLASVFCLRTKYSGETFRQTFNKKMASLDIVSNEAERHSCRINTEKFNEFIVLCFSENSRIGIIYFNLR